MSEKGKCAGGYELPGLGKPCKKCGATDKEPCPEFARQQADEIASLRAQLEAMAREHDAYYAELTGKYFDVTKQLASARKALEPFTRHYESWMERLNDSDQMSVFPRHTMGELRAAKAALSDELGDK